MPRPAEKNTKTTARHGFKKGQSGNPAGRPKGTPNKVTSEARGFCQELITNPAYQQRFRAAFLERTLSDKLEALVWHYAYGKPPQAIELSGTFDHVHYLATKTEQP